jgi:type II restriction enzyme
MALDLSDYEVKARQAVRNFWINREAARQKQAASGKVDQGERASVTAGNNMDEFLAILCDIIKANGLSGAEIHRRRAVLTLPGYFRPTKLWDMIVTHEKQLIAAIELKSHIGPSFGNNFNNRTEEAIGTAHDFWTAYREGAFGEQPRPFAGWLMLVEDAPESRSPVRDKSPHFPVFDDFKDASYVERYDILCRRLVKERLYIDDGVNKTTSSSLSLRERAGVRVFGCSFISSVIYSAAAVIASSRSAYATGEFSELSPMTGLRTFITSLAGHVAAEAARLG